MSIQEQVPRNALVWIIISLFVVVAPHIARIPIWVLAIYILAALWRTMIYRGRWSYPGRWVKVLMTLSCFVGILVSYGSVIGLEPTVALLLTAFALKLVELSKKKDAYVLIFLGYFLCITEFLFSQDILITLYSLLNVLLITTALVALHQPGEHQFNRRSIRLASVMLLQALPLMVVLFFLFPRIGPLWTVPIKSHTAKTGMSDFMKPGDVASLSQSAEVAFRAKFDGDIPPKTSLYWRGLVFSRLEQGTWSSLGYYDVPLAEQRQQNIVTSGEPISYSVIMESTQQSWLYSLAYARSTTPGVMQSSDFRLFSPSPLEAEYLYRARSWPQTTLDSSLSEWRRKTETKLPPKGNPRTRELAATMRAGVESDREFVDAILTKFATEPFVYTLKPGLLTGLDAMDTFLFETQRGFCEHYAAAFVLMMRAAGVPARVVAGYQGGEINPVNKTVIVHQFDAHAWAEVWLEGAGWSRVDPTGAVSPERIQWGLERAMQAEGSFLSEAPLSPLRYRKIPLLNLLRLRYDALTYRWQSWVVGFNNEQQLSMLTELFGKMDARKFASLLLGSWALVLIPVGITLLFKRKVRQTSQLDREYRRFCERMAHLGLTRGPGETAAQFAQRCSVALPAHSDHLERIAALYSASAYSQTTSEGKSLEDETADSLAQFARAIKDFKPDRRRGLIDETLTTV